MSDNHQSILLRQSCRTVSALGPHPAHLVSGMRHWHDRQLLRAGAGRSEDRSPRIGHRLRHRLHRPRRRLRESRFVPHHARPRHPLRHRTEARQPESRRRGLLGRRRPVRHRRQSPDSCRPPQRRPQGHLRQQHDLRHDRRPDGATTPDDVDHLHRALRHLRAGLQPAVPGGSRRRRLRRALDDLPRAPAGAAPCRKRSRRRASASSRSSRPCPTLYQRRNKMGDGLDAMKFYKEHSKIKHGAPTSEVGLTQDRRDHRRQVRRPRTSRLPDLMHAQLHESLGDNTLLSKNKARLRHRRRMRGGFMSLTEIRIAGFGGQGVILSAIVIGKAASIHRGQVRHHDPELRS